jgi:2-polyprenyl-3-methyl-5-hydroxy-6-metoxy-1,4-benzoquinol methylase
MERDKHWDGVYGAKAADRTSWYAPHLERSLAMIRAVADPSSEIIDVGGGASTLVDDLLQLGHSNIAVLDVSGAAIAIAKKRLGHDAGAITWITADITQARLPGGMYDVWHDRAVFHFLTGSADRRAYAEAARKSIKRDGHLVIATFAADGPTRCSGLDVVRYTADTLSREFASGFALEQEMHETHLTPGGTGQSFLYCLFRRSCQDGPHDRRRRILEDAV